MFKEKRRCNGTRERATDGSLFRHTGIGIGKKALFYST